MDSPLRDMKNVKDLIKRLRNTPNWKREEFGGGKDIWKNGPATHFDRAPFEAADLLEELFVSEGEKKGEKILKLKKSGLTLRKIRDVMGMSSHSLVVHYLRRACPHYLSINGKCTTCGIDKD